MSAIECEDLAREGREAFEAVDLGQYTRGMFGMFGGETTSLTLSFSERLAGVVIDRFGKDVIFLPREGRALRRASRPRGQPAVHGLAGGPWPRGEDRGPPAKWRRPSASTAAPWRAHTRTNRRPDAREKAPANAGAFLYHSIWGLSEGFGLFSAPRALGLDGGDAVADVRVGGAPGTPSCTRGNTGPAAPWGSTPGAGRQSAAKNPPRRPRPTRAPACAHFAGAPAPRRSTGKARRRRAYSASNGSLKSPRAASSPRRGPAPRAG